MLDFLKKKDNYLLLIQVNIYKYLGSLITQEGKSIMKIKSKIAQLKTTFIN